MDRNIAKLAGRRPITGSPGVHIRFSYIASFLNECDIQATAVESRDQSSDLRTPVILC